MKNTLVIIFAAVLVLTSCGSKKLEGKYKAAYKVNPANGVDSTTANFTNALLSNAEINMNFKTDGSVEYGVKMGELNNLQNYKYEIVGDSLIMSKDNTREGYFIEHKNDTVHLSTKDITLLLTKTE